jgi:hypothetical protein
MKAIKEKTNIYVQKEVEIDMWQTDDGKKFSNEPEAIKHEEYLKKRNYFIEKYKVKNIDEEDYGLHYSDIQSCRLMCFENPIDEETKNDLMEFYPYLKYQPKLLNKVSIGWNIFTETEYDSNSCSRWGGYNLHIDNVNYIIEEKIKQIERLKNYEK